MADGVKFGRSRASKMADNPNHGIYRGHRLKTPQSSINIASKEENPDWNEQNWRRPKEDVEEIFTVRAVVHTITIRSTKTDESNTSGDSVANTINTRVYGRPMNPSNRGFGGKHHQYSRLWKIQAKPL
ncbi:unnamed protein product [Microthlaspi erraticum]|uniref:Uncharacterized protein n=1 Tax=Microthlaspi erraticum TaxID=1685480 RepID=A0A6D2KZ66_9BRAS|nr:unnamed protein product [Microthlaspi erraticum]